MPPIDLEDVFEDANTIETTADQLAQLSQMVTEAASLQSDIDSLKEALKTTEESLRRLVDGRLPERMLAVGVKSFTTDTGRKVSITKQYNVSITEENREAAFAWLEEHGHSEIIKHTVSALFNRSVHNAALAFAAELRERGLAVKDQAGVHYQTLKAFVREQFEEGKTVPEDLFSLFIYDHAVIK